MVRYQACGGVAAGADESRHLVRLAERRRNIQVQIRDRTVPIANKTQRAQTPGSDNKRRRMEAGLTLDAACSPAGAGAGGARGRRAGAE